MSARTYVRVHVCVYVCVRTCVWSRTGTCVRECGFIFSPKVFSTFVGTNPTESVSSLLP